MENEKPEGAHRCEAYEECAYWAFDMFHHPDKEDSTGWLCQQCGKFYGKSGWVKVEKDKEDAHQNMG